jgi:hypothetical protein
MRNCKPGAAGMQIGSKQGATPYEAWIRCHQIRGLDDTLKSTITLSGSTPPYTISNAQIVAALGGELSFRLRAYFRRKYGWPSLRYDTITVTKL